VTPQEVCAKLADKYESGEWQWIQGTAFIGDTCCCVLGGMSILTTDRGDYRDTKYFFMDVLGIPSIAVWNDHPNRTPQEVLAALRKVSKDDTPTSI